MKITLIENQKEQIDNISEEDVAFLNSPKLERVFSIRRLGVGLGYEILAQNIVGAIKLPSGSHLNITPKLPMHNLFRMLSYVGDFSPLDNDGQYQKDHGLFDILAQIFADELARLLRKGLRQEYNYREARLGTIRGRLLFSNSIKHCLIGSDRIFCGYTTLAIDTPINRAIVAAADALLKSPVIATKTKKQVRASLAHIPAGGITPFFQFSDFKQIHLNRSTSHYRRALFLSQFVLSSASFSNTNGENTFPGFLLDVAKLFENYVSKAIGEQHDAPILISPQKEFKLDLEQEITCKPDLTCATSEATTCIADMKYKSFADLKFINEDVYQMLAYLISHRCREGFLIYPAFNDREVGVLKTIHIPTEIGEIRVHGVCVRLDTPETVRKQLHTILPFEKASDDETRKIFSY